MIVSMASLRQHLRVDHDDEDRAIAAYALAAEQQLQHWLGRPIYRAAEDMPGTTATGYNRYQMVANEAIKVSILQMTERLYNNRGGDGGVQEDAEPPLSVRAMLAGYRVFCQMPAPADVAQAAPVGPA